MNRIRGWLAHLAASLLDGFAALTGFYYSKKYAAISRRLGLRPYSTEDLSRPGLIVIQIDGLAHEYLQQAMAKHKLPNVRRMLSKHGYVLSPWRSGLPSTTPAAQAGIMYGDNDDIPAFRWYDKTTRSSLVFKLPGTAALVQSRIARGRPGILESGSSYVNLFDGSAASAPFSLATLQPRRLFEGVRGAGLLALFLLNPVRTIRTAFLVLQEYAADTLQRFSARWKGHPYLLKLGVYPFVRIFSNVIFREIETFAVLVDIYRGVPSIYATYYGYDDIAHQFGVDSRPAYQALHGIDRCLGQIERLARARLTGRYTLCVLSDHGMTVSEPFQDLYGETLGQYIARELGSQVFLSEQVDGEYDHLRYARFLWKEWKAIEANLDPLAAKVARRIRLLAVRRFRGKREAPEWRAAQREEVVVKSSGSLAHVYFNIAEHGMDLSEISVAFPGLVLKLLAHEGIWLAVAREQDQTLIMARDGILTMGGQGQLELEGKDPLERLPEPQHAAQQLSRMAHFASSGDVILLGDYDPEKNLVVCFERQWGSHGGLGGPQDNPFILWPRRLKWDLSQVTNAYDLYPLLAAERALPVQSVGEN
jgi:hypothetical protein